MVPAGVPAAPTNVVAQVNAPKSLVVSWTAPSGNGSAITGYTVTPSAGTAVNATASPATFTNLAAGTSYTFTVKATNGVGSSAASAASAAVSAADVPGQPTSVTATYQSDGTVLVAWTAPSGNGSAIIDYTITTSGVSGSYTTSSTSYARPSTGLANGTTYSFTVTARNAVGSGMGGTSNSIVYGNAAPPATPQSFTVSGSHYAICYDFTPSVGATSYKVYYSQIQSKVFSDQVATITTTPGYVSVTPNVTYYLAITAVNGSGESAPSATQSAIADTGILMPQCASQASAPR